jgi:hypothetical protein
MNLFRFVYIESIQRRSSRRDAFGISAGPLGGNSIMRKKYKESIQHLASQERSYSLVKTVLFVIVFIVISSLAFWYQFIRTDKSFTAKVDLLSNSADTLLIRISLQNSGDQPATLMNMNYMLFPSDTLTSPLRLRFLGVPFHEPKLPLIVRENENCLLTSKIHFRLSDCYGYSRPVGDVDVQKGGRIAYIIISWSAKNSKGLLFSNVSVLGEIKMDTVLGLNCRGVSFRDEEINLFTKLSERFRLI